MGMRILMDLMDSKNGDELCGKVTKILSHFGISVLNADGSYKDTYTLLCEIAEVWNKDTEWLRKGSN